jgi:hypothetical protein
LDGSRVLYRLGVYSLEFFTMLSRYSFIILIILINLPGFSNMLVAVELTFIEPLLQFWPGGLQELIFFLNVGR